MIEDQLYVLHRLLNNLIAELNLELHHGQSISSLQGAEII